MSPLWCYSEMCAPLRLPIFEIGVLRGDACIAAGKPQGRGQSLPVGWKIVSETYTQRNASLSDDRSSEGGWYICYRQQVVHKEEEKHEEREGEEDEAEMEQEEEDEMEKEEIQYVNTEEGE